MVCPVDPYVDNSYYEAVAKMGNIAGSGMKNITLMGIEPTYPSEKYGYIIPQERMSIRCNGIQGKAGRGNGQRNILKTERCGTAEFLPSSFHTYWTKPIPCWILLTTGICTTITLIATRSRLTMPWWKKKNLFRFCATQVNGRMSERGI